MVRNVAADAAVTAEMIGLVDLLQEFRAARILCVAAQTIAVRELVKLDIRIIRVGLSGAVAAFAGDGFVFALAEFLDLVRVAFIAGFFAGVKRLAGGNFLESIAAIPAVLVKRGRR